MTDGASHVYSTVSSGDDGKLFDSYSVLMVMSGADFWENSLFGLFIFFPLETLLKTVPFHPPILWPTIVPLSTFHYPFSRIHLKRVYINREDRVEVIKGVSIKVFAIYGSSEKSAIVFLSTTTHFSTQFIDYYFMENSIHPIKQYSIFREEIYFKKLK